jgi:ATP-dependent Clp protease ATP-binding subunit ClpE
METLDTSIKKYEAAISLNHLFSRATLSAIRNVSFGTSLLALGGAYISHTYYEGVYEQWLLGSGLILAGIWIEQVLIYTYHNSFYFKGLNSVIGLNKKSTSGATYDLAEILLNDPEDITKAFCTSKFGSVTLLRCGISPEQVDSLLSNSRQKISASRVTVPETEIFSIIGLGIYLIQQDKEFRSMLAKAGVIDDVFVGALRWVVGDYHQEKRAARWWSKDNLSKTSPIGGEWTFGTAHKLQRFSRNIRTSAVFSTLTNDLAFAEEKISEIELALAKTSESNVMIIGEAGVGKIDLVMKVSDRIKTGDSLNSISGKQIHVLDTQNLFAAYQDKGSFEVGFMQLLTEAALAGNNIIVIENISSFITEAKSIGVNMPDLLDRYLAIPDLLIIVTDTPQNFHNQLERLGGFARRFTEIIIDSPSLEATTRLLQNIALREEITHQVFFTYGSLRTIAKAADKYLVEGVMPGKAIELLIDVATMSAADKNQIINDDYVYSVVSKKTGIPAGPIDAAESDLLLHLEDNLKKQVIGQSEAITAIAKTMRRSRAGIQAEDKPIGSFLFLGPTGVGKTETAKTLASTFFGGEDKLQRLDMSEFSDNDALGKLLGQDGNQGTLTNLLREHPYCVLLLDEFEKANKSVHDIFLQILDEGIFTDSIGNKVNARNCIIIATSNAGSQLILKTVKQRTELKQLSQMIIDHIVEAGIYKPELINRFDSTIIFEPLDEREQSEVANLFLHELYARLEERGYQIKINNDLLEILVKLGYSTEFGARPMQRVLQDVIEEKTSQKIISGEIKKGDSVILHKTDFTDDELTNSPAK